MRQATDLNTIIKELEQKDEIISNLRKMVDDLSKQNQKLNSQNVELLLKNKSQLHESSLSQQKLMKSEQFRPLEMQKFETMMEEYKQIKEQERKKEIQSYESLINELVASVNRHKDLEKMWENRCKQQQAFLEQSKKRTHQLNVIAGNKKILIAKICIILGDYFNQKVGESDLLDKVKQLIEETKNKQNQGNVYADLLDSLRMSKLDSQNSKS